MKSTDIAESEEFGILLNNEVSSFKYPTDPHYKVGKICLMIALQNQRAIVMLEKNKLHRSAATLTRPMFEACVRGRWFIKCASENDVAKFGRDELMYFSKKFITDIQKNPDTISLHLSKAARANADLLNNFVHTGPEQIMLWDAENTPLPDITQQDIIKKDISRIINFANSVALFSYIQLCSLAGEKNDVTKKFWGMEEHTNKF